MGSITLKNIHKAFGDQVVIPDANLEIVDGEFVVFVGPSGCGKSTLLRLIAGLEDPTSGEVHIDGKDVTQASPGKRKLSMVFQSYALYPHMTVAQNIGFPLKMSGEKAATIRARVQEVAKSLDLLPYLERRPRNLSGGQRQRVAIGRAIIRQPAGFLFDEPLSNLDAALRVSMRLEISELHQRLGSTMIYVTHDQIEAMTMADRIAVMNAGRIEQFATPLELYRRPANRFVASFIGSPKMNFIDGERAAQYGAHAIGLRPEAISLSRKTGMWGGHVERVEHLGAETIVHVALDQGQKITVRTGIEDAVASGQTIFASPDGSQVYRFDENGLTLGFPENVPRSALM
ncbi:multiple sugar transport system ATP-binding protein [Mycoplana sp. BE70]|uniref:ABC transporter ATP-binding protein n=1 Tax=Mycoplana sp. BE70 TaxID=2817775 RepID=UPI002854B7B2|nr:ABC transporter ATP-binding protein [Mycoplana sp. BE70]MDR6759302.1 multiple sugar transport system ATP-binding protein [Mycoplana sp. BE70]